MDGVGTPIIERPRPLRNQDTPNAAHNTYTLKCEEPQIQQAGKNAYMHLQAKSSLPYKKYMGFYREGMKCQYLCAPAWARGRQHAKR